MPSRKIILFILIASVALIQGCYTFSGASLSPDFETISIGFFQNRASIVNSSLSQTFTEQLKDKFLSQTSLTLTNNDGDLSLEGTINDYNTQPITIQGNETAAQNRLSITVFVKFVNTKDPKLSFESPFTRYYDYDSKLNLNTIEQEAITQITRQLVTDIFNRAASNW
jgi:Lipopolysaccharide-assembly